MNEKEIKGKGSVGIAIAYYSLRGMVSIPLEPCDYNLIFDNGINLKTIKVISCSYKTKYGIFAASIRTSGGNQPKTNVKKFEKNYFKPNDLLKLENEFLVNLFFSTITNTEIVFHIL